MANNSITAKSKAQGPASSLRITPSNSPVLRPPSRSLHKPSLHHSALLLQSVLGTTTTTPTGFSSHDESRSFALCAGSAAVLAELDHENNVSQRFFRARPSATSVNPIASFYNQPNPPTTPDARARSVSNLKLSPHTNFYNGSPSNDFADNGSPRAWSSRERIKAVTSVSISPNGRFLAVGETGYNPRVLIFSTARDSPSDIPLSILNEHTIGVRSLAFSANSQCLATLGNVNDGFLFVWSINLKNGSAKLHSTNKCTSFVRDMCWMGQTLITAGVRHVKVWRIPEIRPGSPTKSRLNADSTPNSSSPAPKALSGRNSLLGSLGDSTFTCVASISDREAVVGTETGILCFLDDGGGGQKLSPVKHFGYSIASLAADFDQSVLWIGGRGRKIQKLSFDSLRMLASSAPLSPGFQDKASGIQKSNGPAVTCIGSVSSHLVTVDTTRAVHIYPMEARNGEDDASLGKISMPAHRDPVLGIAPLKAPNDIGAEFFTWSSKGGVNFWDTQGRCRDSRVVELEQLPGNEDDLSNELKILRATRGMELFVSGDRFGVLRYIHPVLMPHLLTFHRVLSGEPWKCVDEVRAHGGEITDIAVESGPDSCLIASAGRDRMVQLFQRRDKNFQLIQTMDDHVGAVAQLLFIDDGEKLLSSSADRTILVRERVTREVDGVTAVAYIISKVITLKASPISMTLLPNSLDTLIVSTIDRCIQKLDITSGRHIHSFRAADPDSNDTVVMDSLTVSAEIPGQSPRLLIGVSSTDKSIRVYDLERDLLLAGEFGHAEGVSDVLLLESAPNSPENPPKRTLVSAGMDGIVMIWNLSIQPQQPQDPSLPNTREDEETPTKELTVSKPPLRRILSRTELAGFQRQDSLPATPTPVREHSPPLVRKKLSRYSLAPSARNGTIATPSPPSARRSPTSCISAEKPRRSPSPVSPRSTTAVKKPTTSTSATTTPRTRRSSIDIRARPCKSQSHGKPEFGTLSMSTEQVCRTLRAYRKKLNGSPEHLQAQKDLERELSLTLRVLGSRNKTDTADSEDDSSGKENLKSSNSATHIHKAPSTPNLGRKTSRLVSRSRSLDDDGGAGE